MQGSPSSWLLGFLVIGGGAAAAQIGHWLFKRLRHRNYEREELALASQFISVLATLTSLLLAFMAVSIWDGYKTADAAALSEATAVGMLARDLGAYAGRQAPAARSARESLRAYGRCVVDEEWPLLSRAESSPACLDRLNEVFLRVAEIDSRSVRGQVILGEIWARLNEVARFRRERLQASRAAVPSSLWVAVLIATAITLGAAFLLPRTAFGRMMVLLLSLGFGSVFFFIIDMERPFAGPDRISADALARVLKNMDRWDSLARERGR